MTISEYIKKIKESGMPDELQAVLLEHDIWANGACLGFLIMAMEETGNFTEAQIQDAVRSCRLVMDQVSVDESERHYCQSNY